MDAETAIMARDKKKPSENTEQYRKAHKMVRIRIRLAEVAERAAQGLEQDLTQYVNDALRERLERAHLWPPKSGETHEAPP